MADYSRSLGLRSVIVTSFLQGEAKEVGKVIGSIARQVAEYDSPVRRPCALFFGGETTVRVEGSGKGGRNQELAISVAMSIKGLQKVVFTSVGSDGIDGNSDSAGAIVDGKTIMKALEKKLDPTVFLDNNDSNAFLESLRCLIRTGPTGTNVNDLSLLLISS
jgi:hydroxypyruvate reductase